MPGGWGRGVPASTSARSSSLQPPTVGVGAAASAVEPAGDPGAVTADGHRGGGAAGQRPVVAAAGAGAAGPDGVVQAGRAERPVREPGGQRTILGAAAGTRVPPSHERPQLVVSDSVISVSVRWSGLGTPARAARDCQQPLSPSGDRPHNPRLAPLILSAMEPLAPVLSGSTPDSLARLAAWRTKN
jgi:hypothetical protein